MSKTLNKKVMLGVILVVVLLIEIYVAFYYDIYYSEGLFISVHEGNVGNIKSLVITTILAILVPILVIQLFKKLLKKQVEFDRMTLLVITLILIIVTIVKMCMLFSMYMQINSTLKIMQNYANESYKAKTINDLLELLDITDNEREILSQVKSDGAWHDARNEICGLDINYSNFLYDAPKYVKSYRVGELIEIWYYGAHYDFETRGYRELCKYYNLNPYHPYDMDIDECEEQATIMKSLTATSIIISFIYEWLVAFIIIKFIKAKN